jgi:predicted amidohydrolase
MINGSKVTIRLAAVQNRSLRGQVEANLEHAAGLVEQAAAQGAMMAVPPELSRCGYVPNRVVREAAEARGGRTDRWLAVTAPAAGHLPGSGRRRNRRDTASSTCSAWPGRAGRIA